MQGAGRFGVRVGCRPGGPLPHRRQSVIWRRRISHPDAAPGNKNVRGS
jgi:hypothetical protein